MAAPSFPTATLYAGDLAPEVTESVLYEVFSQAGPVASIRVCRDTITRRSLGYAYVNFHSVADAERAIDTLNYTLIKGQPCRVMWSQRDPTQRKRHEGNVYIKNLDPTIDNKALYDTFSAFGNILSCKVATTQDGKSKGFGYVHFDAPQAAKMAIEKVNGMSMKDRIVFVGPFQSKTDRSSTEPVKFTNLYVKNIEESVTEAELTDFFEKYGEITSLMVQKDDEGKSRGFGFVNFLKPEDAIAAVEGMNQRDVKGKTLFVTRAQKKAERQQELSQKFEKLKVERMNKFQGVNLYVKNLDDAVNDERLRSEFSPFGTITSAVVMRDEKLGRSKGFGFVCFSHADEATKAVTEMNGHLIEGKPLYVALAQRKDVRRMQLEAQYAQRQNAMRQAQAQQTVAPGQLPGPIYPQGAQPQFLYPQQPGMPQQGYVPPGYPPPALAGRQPRWGAAQQVPGQPRVGGVPAYGQMQNYMMGQMGQRGGQRPNMRPLGPAQGAQMGPQMGPGGRKSQQGFRYTSNARNREISQQQPAGPMAQQPEEAVAPAVQAGESAPPSVEEAPAPAAGQLTSSMLASASPAQQKQMLGDAIYPIVFALQPDLAGKITGMLLDMENAELLHLIESPDALSEKVDEALTVLRSFASDAESGEAGETKATEASPPSS